MKQLLRTWQVSPAFWEGFARILSVLSFLMICWVAHRVLEVRTQCVHSSFISSVQFDSLQAENCRYQSRLSFNSQILDSEQQQILRSLEILEPLKELVPTIHPTLHVQVDFKEPQSFELSRGTLHIGRGWLQDEQQTARALVMAVLTTHLPESEVGTTFQLEVMTDFLLLTLFKQDEWRGHSMRKEMRLPTTASTFAQYCESPFRSLSHVQSCQVRRPASEGLQGDIWTFQPLLVTALVRVFEKLPMTDQLSMLHNIPALHQLPLPPSPESSALEAKVLWTRAVIGDYLHSLNVTPSDQLDMALKRTYLEMEMITPTRWELTVDITHTPAWREILEQLQAWARLRPRQRVLVFTPKGSVALPVNLAVDLSEDEIQSQKHVMIACQWPKPNQAININARHVYARQSCSKVDQVFWN